MKTLELPSKWELDFAIPADGELLHTERDGETAAQIALSDGRLTCTLQFDSHREPLALSARACVGDAVKLRYLGYRLELYINGELRDEEWPWGEPCLQRAEVTLCRVPLSIRACENKKTELPAVTGSFVNAEGWCPGDGVWVGDCMPYSQDGVYHVFYLKDRRHHKSKWGKGAHQWAHISTRDLRHWEIHPPAVEISDQAEGSICTGSVVCHEGVFYAFYSVRAVDGSSAPLRCSVSRDGYHFEKSTMDVHLSDKYDRSAVRDPKVFSDAEGLYHMLVTTSVRHGVEMQGCLAHLTSRDLAVWHEETEPALRTETYPRGIDAPWLIEPECSDYFYKDGWYYLIARSQYWMSRQPFGPWEQPVNPEIPCGMVPKMAFWRDGRVIFVGWVTSEGFGGTMTFREAVPRSDGTLEFFPVREMAETRASE